MSGELRVIPLRGVPELEDGDDLGMLLVEAATRAGGLEHEDVLVVALPTPVNKGPNVPHRAVARTKDWSSRAESMPLALTSST